MNKKIFCITLFLLVSALFLSSCSPSLQSPTNEPPMAIIITVGSREGPVPLTVYFDGKSSGTLDGGRVAHYRWDIDNNYFIDGQSVMEYTFKQPGTYIVTLTVTDKYGATGSESVKLIAQPGS